MKTPKDQMSMTLSDAKDWVPVIVQPRFTMEGILVLHPSVCFRR